MKFNSIKINTKLENGKVIVPNPLGTTFNQTVGINYVGKPSNTGILRVREYYDDSCLIESLSEADNNEIEVTIVPYNIISALYEEKEND